MADNIIQKKIFLIASANEQLQVFLKNEIARHIGPATIYLAQDGMEALMKIDNDPPHVFISDFALPKKSSIQLVDHILEDKKLKNMAIILIEPIPEQEKYTEEVVIGRIQFMDQMNDTNKVAKHFSKALNFVSHGEQTEFYLRFLALGEVLIHEGEKADNVYIVRKGNLRVYVKRDSTEIEIGTIGVGEFVGEMAYINHELRSADVIATTDCELIEIPIDTLDQVLFTKPSWAKALMTTLSKRVRKANDRIEKIG